MWDIENAINNSLSYEEDRTSATRAQCPTFPNSFLKKNQRVISLSYLVILSMACTPRNGSTVVGLQDEETLSSYDGEPDVVYDVLWVSVDILPMPRS